MRKHTLLKLLMVWSMIIDARADFVGYYGFPDTNGSPGFFRDIGWSGTSVSTANNWKIYSNNDAPRLQDATVRVPAPGRQLEVFGGYLLPGLTHFNIVEVTATCPLDGLFSFNFTLDLGTPVVSHAYYLINGAQFALSGPSGAVNNIPLNAGDVFGFGVSIGPASIPNHLDAHATLTVTNFSAPVPEPSQLTFLLIGAVFIALARQAPRSKNI